MLLLHNASMGFFLRVCSIIRGEGTVWVCAGEQDLHCQGLSLAEDESLLCLPLQGTRCQLSAGKSHLTVNISVLMVTDLVRRVE